MVPFRIYDRENKEMWIVLNFHPNAGSYLVAREDDSESDGEMRLVKVEEMTKFKLVDFLDEVDEYRD
jgi:hypothetical protein